MKTTHWALALAVLAAGCSGSGSSSSKSSTAAAASTAATTTTVSITPAVPAHQAWDWYAGDFHVHTIHSGASNASETIAQSKDLAQLMGLDFVAFSDHDTLSQTQDPDFVSTPDLEVIEAMEWTDVAHAGLIGIKTAPPKLNVAPAAQWPSLIADMIGKAHTEGGIVILYHPMWSSHPWLFPTAKDADAVEVWNNFWTFSDIGLQPTERQDIDDRMDSSGMTAAGLSPSPETVAAVGPTGGGNDVALRFWEQHLNQGRKMAAVGGSDRHKYLPPGYPTTWILGPGKTQDEVLDAVRAGRTLVTQGPDGPFVDFEADADGDNVFEATVGDEVSPGTVGLRVRVRGAQFGKVRLVRDGQIVIETPIPTQDFTFTHALPVQAGEWVRVDVFQAVDWNLPLVTQGLGALPIGSSSGSVQTLLGMWGVSLAIGTNIPVLALDEKYRRIVNFDMTDNRWSRAAISSPIYVR